MFCPFFLSYVKLLRFFFFLVGEKKNLLGGGGVGGKQSQAWGWRSEVHLAWSHEEPLEGCQAVIPGSQTFSPPGLRSWRKALGPTHVCENIQDMLQEGYTTDVCRMNNWVDGRNFYRRRGSRVEDRCGCCVWEPSIVTFSFSIAGFLHMKTEDGNAPPPP